MAMTRQSCLLYMIIMPGLMDPALRNTAISQLSPVFNAFIILGESRMLSLSGLENKKMRRRI
jgi:hypothetical protein